MHAYIHTYIHTYFSIICIAKRSTLAFFYFLFYSLDCTGLKQNDSKLSLLRFYGVVGNMWFLHLGSKETSFYVILQFRPPKKIS